MRTIARARWALWVMMLAAATAVSMAQDVWPLLDRGIDNTKRSSLIHDIPRTGLSAERLVERLLTETTPAVRSALILTLGGYDGAMLATSLRDSVSDVLLKWYADDVDPGVHGAVAWLLGHWGKAAHLAKIDQSQAGRPRGKRQWFVTEEGQTMTVLKGPSNVRMGSPKDEPGRQPASDSAAEPLHTVTIERTFAIAAREITRAEFGRFLSANPAVARLHEYADSPGRMAQILRTFSPEDDNPAIAVTWYEAAMYCNWLSERARLSKAEWVYPIDRSGIAGGMEMPAGYLHRTGYRLPTEAEWEFSARAGTTTARFFGSSEALLSEYAWFSKHPPRNKTDAADPADPQQTSAVGLLKPNDFGLFDVYGNVWEWTQDRVARHQSGEVHDDREDDIRGVDDAEARTRRGGAFPYEAAMSRSAARGTVNSLPGQRRDNVGFRIARTMQ